MARYVYQGSELVKNSSVMCEDKSYLGIKVTDKDIKEKGSKRPLAK